MNTNGFYKGFIFGKAVHAAENGINALSRTQTQRQEAKRLRQRFTEEVDKVLRNNGIIEQEEVSDGAGI